MIDAGTARRSSAAVTAPLLLVWSIALFAMAQGESPGGRAVSLQSTVDPNSAPWWELTVLPEIGETTAKEIVRFRDRACANGSAQAFRHAADLDQVRGIGPKTLARLGPHLRFEDRCPP